MDTLPCQCAGLRINKCRCKVLHTGYRCDESGSYLVLAKSRSLDRYLNLGEKNPNVVLRFIENFYEQCAGYNLRLDHIYNYVYRCLYEGLKSTTILPSLSLHVITSGVVASFTIRETHSRHSSPTAVRLVHSCNAPPYIGRKTRMTYRGASGLVSKSYTARSLAGGSGSP